MNDDAWPTSSGFHVSSSAPPTVSRPYSDYLRWAFIVLTKTAIELLPGAFKRDGRLINTCMVIRPVCFFF